MRTCDHIPEGIIPSCHLRDHMVKNASFRVDVAETVKAASVFALHHRAYISATSVEINRIHIDCLDLRALWYNTVDFFRQEDAQEVPFARPVVNSDAPFLMQYSNSLAHRRFRDPTGL